MKKLLWGIVLLSILLTSCNNKSTLTNGTVYMWSYVVGFNKQTGLESQAGHSLPAVIHLKKKNKQYTVINYKEPQDGSLYPASIKKMFPKKYRKHVYNDAGNVKYLQEEMNEKAAKWLAQ